MNPFRRSRGADEQGPQSSRKKRKTSSQDHVSGHFKAAHEVETGVQTPAAVRHALSSRPYHSSLGPPIPPQDHRPGVLPPLPPIPDDISQVVFTHPSAAQGNRYTRVNECNDRLEFLGDAYIELMASRLLFPLMQDSPVGRLSQQRELLVKNETLANYALAYKFDKKLKTAPGWQRDLSKSGGKFTKTMGDVLEAYVAAIVVSQPETGFQIAETWLKALWQDKMTGLEPVDAPLVDLDNKQNLARKVMSKGTKLEYREEAPQELIRAEGKTLFHMGVFLTGWGHENVRLGGGTGLSRRDAGQEAAGDALRQTFTNQIGETKKAYDMKMKTQREHEVSTFQCVSRFFRRFIARCFDC